jgi:hypothetical protein
LKFRPGAGKFWTKDISRKRWTALYKAFKDAKKLGAKGNSCAGATAQQIFSNTTSLLVMQHRKCPSFEAMEKLFGETPSCKPVNPQELGGMSDEGEGDSIEDDGDDGQEYQAPALAEAAAAAPAETGKAPAAATAPLAPATGKAAAAAAALAATGKAAAAFHLAPSKGKVRHHCHRRHHCVYVTVTQDKKMDLGEAYMKAQQLKIESAAVTANTKTRTDLVIAMMVQKKTPEEIAAILKLAGF